MTIIFGGSVGLWLLPVLLSIFGGEKQASKDENGGSGENDSPRNATVKPAKTVDVELVKMGVKDGKEELEKKSGSETI